MIPTPKTAKHLRWNVLLVDVPEALATRCEEILAPLVVVRASGAEALDRLPLVQPLVTCAGHHADVGRIALLRERSNDVGAVFVLVPEQCPASDLEKLLRRALVEADAKC